MNLFKASILSMLLISMVAFSAPMECKVGPIEMDLGGNKWLVYACIDSESIIAVSARGNPAMPFFFSVSLINGKYAVSGEGNGDTTATDSAYQELIKLQKEDVEKIITQAKKV